MLRRHRNILIVLGLVLSASGCANVKYWWNNGLRLGPNHCPPNAAVSETWVDTDDQRLVHGQQLANWWEVFNDPDLEQVIRVAYQRNLSLKVACLRVLEARRQRDITAANLLPQQQTLSGGFVRNKLSLNQATSSTFIPRRFNQFDTGFDVGWEIDVWGRIRRAIEAQDAAIEASVAQYDDILVTLIADVAATYIEIRTFDERLTLAEENIEIQSGSLRIATVRKNEGKVSELDVQEATANLADTRALIPSLEKGRRQAVNRMALLLGMRPTDLDPVFAERGQLPVIPREAVVGIPAELLRRRPDIRAAEQAVAAQSASIGIAQAELFPQFSLGGQLALSAEDFSDLFTGPSSTGFIAPGFSWKILNYGRLRNAVEIERLRWQQDVLNYENAVLAAHREVEDALVDFLRTQDQVEQLEISTAATEKTVEIVRTKYKEGSVDFGRVFVLEGGLVQRQDQLVATKAQIAVALTQLYKALGGGWELKTQTPTNARDALVLTGEAMTPQPDELTTIHDAPTDSKQNRPVPPPGDRTLPDVPPEDRESPISFTRNLKPNSTDPSAPLTRVQPEGPVEICFPFRRCDETWNSSRASSHTERWGL